MTEKDIRIWVKLTAKKDKITGQYRIIAYGREHFADKISKLEDSVLKIARALGMIKC